MTTTNPVELDRLFEEALNAGDLDRLAALYEPDAALMPTPGTVVNGTTAIREALARFVAMKPKIVTSGRLVARTGDIALLANDWTLDVTGPDGKLKYVNPAAERMLGYHAAELVDHESTEKLLAVGEENRLVSEVRR